MKILVFEYNLLASTLNPVSTGLHAHAQLSGLLTDNLILSLTIYYLLFKL